MIDASSKNDYYERKNKILKDRIRKLENEIFEIKEIKSKLLEDCDLLTDRCFTITKGSLCSNCNLNSFECKHSSKYVNELMEDINKFRKNNNVEEFLNLMATLESTVRCFNESKKFPSTFEDDDWDIK